MPVQKKTSQPKNKGSKKGSSAPKKTAKKATGAKAPAKKVVKKAAPETRLEEADRRLFTVSDK